MSMVTNHAFPASADSIFPSGEREATSIGIPYDTARPPKFAMNILVDVSLVISSVSLVSDEFNAPYGTLIRV